MLIAAACIVVIGSAAYFVVMDRSDRAAAQAIAKARQLRAECATSRPGERNEGATMIYAWCKEQGFVH